MILTVVSGMEISESLLALLSPPSCLIESSFHVLTGFGNALKPPGNALINQALGNALAIARNYGLTYLYKLSDSPTNNFHGLQVLLNVVVYVMFNRAKTRRKVFRKKIL